MAQAIKQTKLSGKKIGVFFGTFAPLHIGHQAEIYKAAALNDGVIIVASGYEGDRGSQIGLPVKKRFRYLREAFNDEPQIRVDMLVEDDIPKIPDGWDQWLAMLLEKVTDNIEDPKAKITFYTGERDYQVELEKRLPDQQRYAVSLMDRTILNISGTEIRENPLRNWDYINRVFRRQFTKKVIVVGAADTGKSTLVRRLARTSNSPFSEAFIKQYRRQSNVINDELDVQDYVRIIQGQFDANSAEIRAASNNGLTFFDTDALVTKTYAQRYLSEADQQLLEDLFNTTLDRETIDLLLVVPPLVGESIRHKSDKNDQFFYDTLNQLIDRYGFREKTVYLDAPITPEDPHGIYGRYLQALDAIQERTGFDIKHLNDQV